MYAVLGLCAAIVLGWACALWSQPRRSTMYLAEKTDRPVRQGVSIDVIYGELQWPCPIARAWRAPQQRVEVAGFGVLRSQMLDAVYGIRVFLESNELAGMLGLAMEAFYSQEQLSCGWPWLALTYRQLDEPRPGMYYQRWPRQTDPVLRLGGTTPYWPLVPLAKPPSGILLPVVPIWRGLAADAMLFGLVAFAIVGAGRRVRSALRRSKGLCSRCGYDLIGLRMDDACPECGSAVLRKVNAP
jgi:hypothetical protein